jgi:hypothetical protein
MRFLNFKGQIMKRIKVMKLFQPFTTINKTKDSVEQKTQIISTFITITVTKLIFKQQCGEIHSTLGLNINSNRQTKYSCITLELANFSLQSLIMVQHNIREKELSIY